MRWSSKERDTEGTVVKAPSREEHLLLHSTTEHSDGGLPISAQEVIGMQRLAGNQTVLQMLNGEAASSHEGNADPASQSGDVRLHTGTDAANAARAMGVQAFTWGNNIFFAEGKYQPNTKSGRQLLSHEFAHVAQQRSSSSNAAPDAVLESEAQRAETGLYGHVPMQFSSAGGACVQGKADAASHGFWSTVGGAIFSAGEAIWSGIKAVGSGIATAAGAVGSGIKWLGKQLLDKVSGAFGRVMQWIMQLPARVGRLLSGLLHGIATIRPWTLAWWESLVHITTWKHFVFWVGARLIELLEIGGVGEILETISEFIKFNTRALAGREIAIAQKIFGKSINFGLVRIDMHSVVPAFTHRAFTTFHTINAWGDLPDETLIHELTHVWQYERAGAIYMAQAVHAQIQRGGGAYNYGGPDGLKDARAKGRGLLSFNREEQAQIVEDFYRIKNGMSPYVPGGTIADLPLYAHFVKTVSTLSESELLA
jgi:hypothetical protein